ncbi:tRNA (adenosine(37)-N6)-threonylcarbamoyltransferase complex dimerization subunit type 1 TsaB [Derxia lacustris]|uniref:tRNA (adenosine(37)-N6)-threonylcarbamoyltransferase complex dimerization subunit type 1 TsaB n=1 Tax=Derxia lacustris TaxID=764842 RepID=UPI000A175185|nr:tRNA (adenosine(37)-N6)-threonylcarbamoyltransferase complex dimerization subunit type 1 TsaB [Derxia lacustris]
MSDHSTSIILALDTSGPVTGVALLAAHRLRELQLPGGPEASRQLLPQIVALLADEALALDAVDAIAYGAGPGAFTGIRTSAAVAQGLGFVLDVDVLPVGTLDALASSVAVGDRRWLLTVIDARMGELYAALYRATPGAGGWQTVLDPFVAAADRVLAEIADAIDQRWDELAVVGATTLLPGLSPLAQIHPALGVTAGAIARLARQMLAGGRRFAPEFALPVYVRNKVAQTLAERFPPQS